LIAPSLRLLCQDSGDQKINELLVFNGLLDTLYDFLTNFGERIDAECLFILSNLATSITIREQIKADEKLWAIVLDKLGSKGRVSAEAAHVLFNAGFDSTSEYLCDLVVGACL
jgi:hypothetical protein